MEDSALREVFGSTASLSELSGDTDPNVRVPVGYSRFGLNEHRPSHQMHTTVRRYSNETPYSDLADVSGSGSITPYPVSSAGASSGGAHGASHSRSLWIKVPLLAACGIAHSLIMHSHVLPFVELARYERARLLVISTILAMISGLVIPSTDVQRRLSTGSSGPGSPRRGSERRSSGPNNASSSSYGSPASPASSEQQSWASSLVRLYGALLGLVYFANKLPRDATFAWLLIAPSMWYIANTTMQGLLAAIVVAVVGAGATLLQYISTDAVSAIASAPTTSQHLQDFLFVGCGSAAGYFGTALVFAEIGRGLCN